MEKKIVFIIIFCILSIMCYTEEKEIKVKIQVERQLYNHGKLLPNDPNLLYMEIRNMEKEIQRLKDDNFKNLLLVGGCCFLGGFVLCILYQGGF